MDRLASACVKIGALGLMLMTLIVGWQVFGRFILQSSPSWSEQAALVLMIWYVFLAAGAGVWERFHIRIEILEQRLAAGSRKHLRIAIHALIAAMGLILLVFGVQLVWLVSEHVIPSLGISRAFAYLPIPATGALITLFSLGRIRVRLAETD